MDSKNKKAKGITLIALIITIIILLILAGVAISNLTENGLFEKTKIAKQKQTEAEVKEKISLLVSEYVIEREQGKTLSQFLTEKKDNEEIEDFTDNNDGTFDIIINGYVTTINESDLSTTEPQILSDIMVTCLAKEFINNKIQVLITVKSQSIGIKEIRLLNNVTVQGNNKNTIAFDHTIDANTEYQVEVKLTDGTTSTKTIKYEDTEAPTAKIEIPTKIFFKKGTITANVKLEDNRSGVNLSQCKWVVNTESENITDESLFTEGPFTSNTQTITTEEITEEGIYYIHLLLKDNVGNTTQVISESVEIKDGYLISTPEDLQAMGTDLEGNYYVVNDIDMTGFDFQPISGYFRGNLDGQGHIISNLTINNSEDSDTAIFKYLYGGNYIKNILFKNVDVKSSNAYGTAVIAGMTNGNGDIIFEKVGITGNITGKGKVGTFLYTHYPTSKLKFIDCYARTNIKTTNGCDAGGFIGYNWNSWYIEINNCYWSGTIDAQTRVGTFCANLANNNQDTTSVPVIENCYYNSDLFKLSVPEEGSGIGLTTDQFANSSNFTGWDFTNDWYIDEETGYPELHF